MKPPFGELSHCIGVRALSRLTLRTLAMNTSALTLLVSTSAFHAFLTAMSSHWSMLVNGKSVMPSSSPW